MIIAIIDGQGGGMGKMLTEKLRAKIDTSAQIIALGTNAAATTAMIKGGADAGATGENAICLNAARADIICGSVGIIMANALMGELTPQMASAIGSSEAIKILVPMNRCNLMIAGTIDGSMQQYVEDAVEKIASIINLQNDK
ncbi:MAG: DUF3842 family protein [Eubacteriales bacterium]|jgi:hypothetical protein|nr:DUF3842 family protein [Eubacteriales bacterium]MDD3504117.1 DUF3842 family protein [Eubacteriales bacterium]MDD4682464.1 DUF3842 family protein [Eubacteriales bacterium]